MTQDTYPDVKQYAGGWLGDKLEGPTSGGFPILFNANSYRQMQSHVGIDEVPPGYGIGNMGSSHDAVFRHESIGLNLFNSTELRIIEDPEGAEMLQLRDNTVSDSYRKWIPGSGAAGPSHSPPYLDDPSGFFSGGTNITSYSLGENFIAFLCCWVSSGMDTTKADQVGFDLGGVAHASWQVGVSLRLNVNAWLGGQFALSQAVNPTNKFLIVDFNDVSIASDGRYVIAVAVNSHAGPHYGKRHEGANGTIESGVVANTLDAYGWGSTFKPFEAGFGDNAVRDQNFGIHQMGIKNYSQTITENELERVTAFMGKTGLLPWWWL